jgi:hypothetical protein
MSKKPRTRKTGKPHSLELELVHSKDNSDVAPDQQTPEEFAKEFFPSETAPTGEEIGTAIAVHQDGLPTIEWLKKNYKTKSACIRYLHSLGPQLGFPTGTPPKIIAKHLGIRQQHARNVCKTPLKRGPNEDWRPKENPSLTMTVAPLSSNQPNPELKTNVERDPTE